MPAARCRLSTGGSLLGVVDLQNTGYRPHRSGCVGGAWSYRPTPQADGVPPPAPFAFPPDLFALLPPGPSVRNATRLAEPVPPQL